MAETRSSSSWIVRWVVFAVAAILIFKFFTLMYVVFFAAGYVSGVLFTKPKG